MLYPWPVGVKLVSCSRASMEILLPTPPPIQACSSHSRSSSLQICGFCSSRSSGLKPKAIFYYSFSHNIFFCVSLKPHIDSATAQYSSAHGLACPSHRLSRGWFLVLSSFCICLSSSFWSPQWFSGSPANLVLSWCAGEAPPTPSRDKDKTELCLQVSLSTYDCHDLSYHMSLQSLAVLLRSAMHMNTGLDFASFYLEWFNRVSPWPSVYPIWHHSYST